MKTYDLKVLVTGGSGFIGQHLVKRLRLRSDVSKVVSVSRKGNIYPSDLEVAPSPFGIFSKTYEEVNCNVEYDRSVASLMLRYKPDVVFHLAGNPIIKESESDPTAISRSNILATHNLLAYSQPGCRFVLASSAAVYGDKAGRGDWVPEDCPTVPTSVYGATKLASEALVQAYTSLGKVSGVSLRLIANVGVGATHGLLRDIIRKLKSDEPTLSLLGDSPGSRKHYMHVSDTVDAFVYFGLCGEQTGPINIANYDTITVDTVAKYTMKAIGINKLISWAGSAANWKGDNPVVQVSSALANGYGWQPKYDSSIDAVVLAAQQMEGIAA